MRNLISKGCIDHLVLVKDIDADEMAPTLQSMTVVNEYPEVYPQKLPSIPPNREIVF